jgi:putative transposase
MSPRHNELSEGTIYCVCLRTAHRRLLFTADADYAYFLRLLRKYKFRFDVSVYAFCLFPSGIFLVIRSPQGRILPLFVDEIKQTYSLYIAQRRHAAGGVWHAGFKQKVLSDDGMVVSWVRAVEHLPVRKGLVPLPAQYPWSSAIHRVMEEGQSLIDRYFIGTDRSAGNNLVSVGEVLNGKQ